MLAQRGQGVEARKVTAKEPRPRERQSARADRAGRSGKPKLGFKDQHELKTLPERIAKLEAAIGKLRAVLADPELYARDPARFDKASAMLAQAETELSAAEDRWLALEMQRDAQQAG